MNLKIITFVLITTVLFFGCNPFDSEKPNKNKPPAIKITTDTTISVNDTIKLSVESEDEKNGTLEYIWQIEELNLSDTISESQIIVVFPDTGTFKVIITAIDEKGKLSIPDTLKINVIPLPTNQVVDFAPAEIGTKWSYSYLDYSCLIGNCNVDSQRIELRIAKNDTSGIDTVLQLQINQTGLKFSSSGIVRYTPDTITEIYFDTVIIRGDSLYRKGNYQCPIFPFWNSHAINSDSLKIDTLNGEKLYSYHFYQDAFQGKNSSSYGQNIGMYKHSHHGFRGGLSWGTNIKLLSFSPPFISGI